MVTVACWRLKSTSSTVLTPGIFLSVSRTRLVQLAPHVIPVMARRTLTDWANACSAAQVHRSKQSKRTLRRLISSTSLRDSLFLGEVDGQRDDC